MKHENLFKIYIPEPCHEDWGKMTANEQGAFCKVCSKTVVDFSEKSDNEINDFLLANMGKKVCGRFKNSQVEENETAPLKNELNKIQHIYQMPGFMFPINYTPMRTYAMAFLLLGSVAIIGCSNSDGTGSGGDIKIEHVSGGFDIKPETVKDNNKTDNAKTKEVPENNLLGAVSIKPPKDTVITVDTTKELRMLGEISIKDTLNNTSKDSVKTYENKDKHYTMGKMLPPNKTNKDKDYKKGEVKTND